MPGEKRTAAPTQRKLTDRNRTSKQRLGLHFSQRQKMRPFVLDVLFSTLKVLLFAIAIVGFGSLGLVFGVTKAYIDTTPVLDIAQLTKSDRTSYLYDMDGNEITTISAIEYRDWVDIDEIPDMLINAFISVEDVRFYKHQGVDFKRLFSAALEILGNSNSSGGSTITQQLIKNKILGSERTYKRKIQEAYLALQLEKVIDKDQILEAYLNDIYLGGSNYGIKTAAKDYFNKALSELTIRECAMLAGLTQNPYRYNPRQNMYYRKPDSFDVTQERTNSVLDKMYQNGYITLSQYQNALSEDVAVVQVSENSKMYDMAYFVEYAIYDVITYWMQQDDVADTASNRTLYENKLRTGGYKIYTTVDPKVQNTVQTSLSSWENYPQLADSSNAVMTETISDGVVLETVEPQAAAVVIDQSTGELRAIVGGRDEPSIRKGLNRAYQSYMEVGSAIKPLAVYGPALDLGASPATVLANVDGSIDGWGGETGYPKGGLTSDSTYGPVTIRTGVVKSLNVVAARTLFQLVGINNAVAYLKKLNIDESQINQDGPGLALGTTGLTPIQMCAAYAAIANNGYYLKPLSFTSVVDEDGNVILDANVIRGSAVRIYERSCTAYLLVDMLTDAVRVGTGKAARIQGFEVAGKTGTNSDYASVYFAGMTCKYTAVVWIGHDQPANKLKKGSSGGDYAAPLWQDFMSSMMNGEESNAIINESPVTLGLVERTVCPVSGLLATDACVAYQSVGSKFNLVTDWFDYSSVPTTYCDMHVTLDICTHTNCLAGENCDDEHVNQTTFVLIQPSSVFYGVEDDVLARVFGDTYRKTDKTIAEFVSEYPVCSQSSSLEELDSERNALIASVSQYLDENQTNISAEDRDILLNAVSSLSAADLYPDISAGIESLTGLLAQIKDKYKTP